MISKIGIAIHNTESLHPLCKNPTVNEKVYKFYKDCKARGLSEETSKEYAAVAKEFLIINKNPAFDVREKYIDHKPRLEAFKLRQMELNLSYSRVKYKFTALGNLYRLWLDDGLISINPVPDYRKRYIRIFKPESVPERQLIEIEDFEKLIKFSNQPYERIIFLLAGTTGMRRGELRSLNKMILT